MKFITITAAIVILAIAFKKELLAFFKKAGPVLADFLSLLAGILAAIWHWLEEKVEESEVIRTILIILGVIIEIVLFVLLLYAIFLFFSWLIPGSIGFWVGIATDILITMITISIAAGFCF